MKDDEKIYLTNFCVDCKTSFPDFFCVESHSFIFNTC